MVVRGERGRASGVGARRTGGISRFRRISCTNTTRAPGKPAAVQTEVWATSVDGPKPLRIRTWTCRCGATLDRDYNAAVNVMLAAGLAERLNAHGGDVRRVLALAGPDEVGTRLADSRRSA
ncbi:transposase [Rhodococcus hoagii]|nr:transposase [Prescottella equi]